MQLISTAVMLSGTEVTKQLMISKNILLKKKEIKTSFLSGIEEFQRAQNFELH